MSYELATAHIITMMEAVPSLAKAAEFGSALVHDPEYNPAVESTRPTRHRRFALLGLDGASDPRFIGGTPTRGFDDVQITIAYQEYRNVRTLDLVIRNDYEAIRDYILLPANWGRPASRIVLITPGSDSDALPFRATLDKDGNRTLEIDVALAHTQQAS